MRNSPHLEKLNGKRKKLTSMIRWQIDGLHIQTVDKSSLEEESNNISALNHPVWRTLNDLLAHLLENIAFTKDFNAWFSMKTKRMKMLLASIGSPCLWPYLEQYVVAVSFQIIM